MIEVYGKQKRWKRSELFYKAIFMKIKQRIRNKINNRIIKTSLPKSQNLVAGEIFNVSAYMGTNNVVCARNEGVKPHRDLINSEDQIIK